MKGKESAGILRPKIQKLIKSA